MTIEAVDGALDVVVEASRYSPTYGVVVPASCVVMRLLADAEALRWRVAWTGGA
jgi:hypothetical protein